MMTRKAVRKTIFFYREDDETLMNVSGTFNMKFLNNKPNNPLYCWRNKTNLDAFGNEETGEDVVAAAAADDDDEDAIRWQSKDVLATFDGCISQSSASCVYNWIALAAAWFGDKRSQIPLDAQ